MIFNQIDVQASMGLGSAISSSGEVHSPLSDSSIWMSQCFPGLSGIVRVKKRDVVVLIVDEIIPVSTLIVSVLPPKSLDPEPPGLWTVHVQSPLYGWQFSCMLDKAPDFGENPKIIFIKWVPGSLSAAVQCHDDLYIAKTYQDDELMVGSDFEKESMSRYHLAIGQSSIAHALTGKGVIKGLIGAPGLQTPLDLPFATMGIALPAQAI